MTHEALRERLLDLAYGELPARDAREVEAHAASCAECGAELARIRETRQVMRALPADPAPDAGERILLAAAREAAHGRARRVPRWFWSASAVAALAVAVTGISYRILEERPARERDELSQLGKGAPPPSPAEPPAPAHAADAPPGLLADRSADDERRQAPARADATRGGRSRAAPEAKKAAPAPEPALAAPGFAKAPPPAAPDANGDADLAQRLAAPAPRAEKKRSEAAEEEVGMGTRRDAAHSRADAGTASRAPAAAAPPPAPARAEAPRLEERYEAQASAPRDEAPAPAAARPSRKAAAPSAVAPGVAPAPAPADAALERYQALRASGRLRGAIQTFAECAGESWRKVEADPEGRVVMYVRQGRIGGRNLRIDHLYAQDGTLARATVRDADTGEPVDLAGVGVALPARAGEAAIDAAPRCGP